MSNRSVKMGPGYRGARVPDPRYPNSRHYFEHRYVVEAVIGRRLKTLEYVHHRDGNKENNALENLQIIDPKSHARLHNGWVAVADKWFKTCGCCGRFLAVTPSNFTKRLKGECRRCGSRKQAERVKRRRQFMCSFHHKKQKAAARESARRCRLKSITK